MVSACVFASLFSFGSVKEKEERKTGCSDWNQKQVFDCKHPLGPSKIELDSVSINKLIAGQIYPPNKEKIGV